MGKLKKSTAEMDKLPLYVKLAYGTGHVLNDLAASLWFTYVLLYFHQVLGFSNSLAGYVMVVGQVADGCATVFVGYFQDNGKDFWLCRVYDKRKAWHLVGTVGVVLSWPFVFNTCVGCSNAPKIYQFLYYSFFIVILQFTWPCAQISHLAIITDLTPSKMERTALTSYRYSATVLSSLTIYLCMWMLLGPLSSGETNHIGPSDAPVFRNVTFIAIGIGSVTSLFFHVAVSMRGNVKSGSRFGDSLLPDTVEDEIAGKKGDTTHDDVSITSGDKFLPLEDEHLPDYSFRLPITTIGSVQTRRAGECDRMELMDWLREPQLYQVSALYLSSRLFVNLSQSYITLYLDVTLQLKPKYIAIVPLFMMLSGLLTSPLVKTITRIVGRKGTFVLACLLGMGGAVWVWFGGYTDSNYTTKWIYFVAVFFGAGGGGLLITSISAIADFIGDNPESGALVYAITSLADKLASAIAFVLIQNHVPEVLEATRNYYKDVLVFACGGTSLFILVVLITMIPTKLGRRRRNKRGVKKKWLQGHSENQ